MDIGNVPSGLWLGSAGVLFGLWLLSRGLGGYRTATRIGDLSTSSIASLAAGEVRISGSVEFAELGLVSPLQSRPCVFYRSLITTADDVVDRGSTFEEERAVGFHVRDAGGTIRVFPRGARWDAPLALDAATGAFGDEPAALQRRTGGAFGPTGVDRDAAIAALLTVKSPAEADASLFARTGYGAIGFETRAVRAGSRNERRRYREARLEPGDAVTVVGRAIPFSDLSDPAEADVARGSAVGADDVEVVADLAAARSAGLLLDDPEEAWGNAAIPGFGIGRPVRAPELDPAAGSPTLGTADDAQRTERRFAIAPDTLVLASAPGVPLLIAHGIPGAAVDRHRDRFTVGLFGAVLAIGSAVVLALTLAGGSGR